jgi:glycosyltransferase involved in cell wall biosynthesis
MRPLVVLPSYNESDNIVRLVEALVADPRLSVCVVDDSSPDGTSELVTEELSSRPGWAGRVHVITRLKKDGRGGAVRDGFSWGMAEGFNAFVEMDCDFSHRPEAVGEGLGLLSRYDVVLGSRYPDGTISGWPMTRRVFSRLANLLARVLIDRSIADYTNGFRFYSREAVTALLARPQRYRGYIYLSESLSELLKGRFRVGEFPIYFENRTRGESSTDIREVFNALSGIIAIGWRHRFRR